MSPEVCPNCGAEVPAKAKACPECGSDEQTGWSEEARYDSLDLPDENFNYKKFVEDEFRKPKPIPRGIHWFWWLIAMIAVGMLIWFSFR